MSLDGSWIEVFRAGDYGERGNWTAGDLDRLAATYDARLHAAPVVLGHPAHDAPAYGWVKRLRRAGESLWAQLEKVDPALEALLRAGRFAQRSVALYKQFPLTGGPYLRHLGFLGAAPPEVKGLAPLWFTSDPRGIGAFFSPFKFIHRKTTDSPGNLELFATLRALHFHDAGGDNQAGGPKDTYFTYRGDLFSAGRGQNLAISGKTFQYGEGDAIGTEGSVDFYGNCFEGGGECAEGGRLALNQGAAAMTATVSGYNAGARSISYSSPANENTLGVGRYILNTTAAKVYTTGSVLSVNSSTPPVVTGTGTAWATQFGAGAHTDLCFSQNDDDAGGLKFVVPIRSVNSDTSLTLDYDPQAVDRAWPGDNNGSSYRIYKCAQTETLNPAGGSFTHLSGGTTDWVAADTLEVPLGWAFFGDGLRIVIRNTLPALVISGITITQTGADEPLDRALTVGGKASVGLQFDNTWECKANGVNCTSAGATTGIRFNSPPTWGMQYAASNPSNVLIRLSDTNATAGNAEFSYAADADRYDLAHSAASSNAFNFFVAGASAGLSIGTTWRARTRFETNGASAYLLLNNSGSVPGSGLIRVSSGNGGTPILVTRNQANTADHALLTYSTSDRLQLGGAGVPVEVVAGLLNDGGGFKHRRLSTGSCGASGCQVTVSWATAFADANYTVSCSVQDSTSQSETAGLRFAKISSLTASSVTVDIDNLSGSALTGTVHCTAIHD